MSESTAVVIPEPVSVPGMTQELYNKQAALRDTLQSNLPQILAALPKGVKAEKLASAALTAALDNPQLLDCHPLSLVRGVLKAATLGLRFGETCDLVPIAGKAECWVRVKGVVELAQRAGAIVWAREGFVCQGDEFEYEERADGTWFRHRPASSPKLDASNVTHVYAAIQLPDRTRVFEVWPVERILAHKAKFVKNNKPDSVWNRTPLNAYAKTVVKAALRFAPLSPELRGAIEAGDDVGDGTFEVLPAAGDPTVALREASGALAALDAAPVEPPVDATPILQGDPPTEKQLKFLQNLLNSHVFTDKERRAVETRVTSRQKAKDAIDWAQKTMAERKAAEANDVEVEELPGSAPMGAAA